MKTIKQVLTLWPKEHGLYPNVPEPTNSYWYWGKHETLLRRNKYDILNNGECDALWRTALLGLYTDNALIQYRCSDAVSRLCFNYTEIKRHPECKVGASRDQVTAALVFLKLKGYDDALSALLDKLQWRLSDFHNQTIDFWLWQKSLKGNFWYCTAFLIVTFFQIPFIWIWNEFLSMIAGFKSVSQSEYNPKPKTDWQRRISKLMYPAYAWFLLAHQIISIRKSVGRTIVEIAFGWATERSNLVVRQLVGDYTLRPEDIENYRSMAGIRHNSRLDGSANDNMYFLNEAEREENDLDKMMMEQAYSIYKMTH